MQVHLTLVISCRRPWLCVGFVLGVADDGWTYKESYDERHDVICVQHWQCIWVIHVERTI
jgi:hypothetical protein